MSNTLQLTAEQRKAYDRYIRCRDKMKLVPTKDNRSFPFIPQSDTAGCVDVEGLNHPLFIVNDAWLEYKEAFQAWLDIEPTFRDKERMRASRGDYGKPDNWEDK